MAPTLSPMRGLSRVVIGLLALDGAMFVLSIVLDATEIGIVRRTSAGTVRPGEMATILERQDAFIGGYLLILLATVILWMIWQYRGQRNLHRAGRALLRFRPGWAVGWWFIPIANWWKPFQTVRELWSRSDPDERIPEHRGWWIIGVWWATLLAANFLFFDDPAPTTPDGVISARGQSIVGAVAGIVATGLAIAIVLEVARRQEALVPVIPPRPDVAPTWRALPSPPVA